MKRWAIAAWAGIALTACTADDTGPLSDHFPAMGTLVEVTLREVPGTKAPAVFRDLRDGFALAEHDWYGWGDGALGRYNAAHLLDTDGALEPGLATLLARAQALRDSSMGLFEPRIGALTELWGFHDGERASAPPPSEADIAAWRAGALGERIDLGAYAKGVAVAEAIERLRGLGVLHALVNAGGDVAVLGDAGGRPWRIGIRDPRGAGVMAGIELADGEAIFTSGDYERAFEWEGRRYHHILDPRTGWPASGTASVTVLDRDAARADAAATALFVAGEDWPKIAARMGITQAMRVRADGVVEMTGAFAARATFEQNPDSVIVDGHVVASR